MLDAVKVSGRWISKPVLDRITARTLGPTPPTRQELLQDFCRLKQWHHRKGEPGKRSWKKPQRTQRTQRNQIGEISRRRVLDKVNRTGLRRTAIHPEGDPTINPPASGRSPSRTQKPPSLFAPCVQCATYPQPDQVVARGSQASRKPSPTKFSARSVLTSIEAGKTSSHQ